MLTYELYLKPVGDFSCWQDTQMLLQLYDQILSSVFFIFNTPPPHPFSGSQSKGQMGARFPRVGIESQT